MERLTEKFNGNYALKIKATNEEDARKEVVEKFKKVMKKLGEIENFLEDYNLTIEELKNLAKNKQINIIEINGLLTDCIIDIIEDEDIEDEKILNLFERLSWRFYENLLITFGEI